MGSIRGAGSLRVDWLQAEQGQTIAEGPRPPRRSTVDFKKLENGPGTI